MKDDNRNLFPTVAKIVDELRQQGFEPKVIWCREGNQERGKRPEWAKEQTCTDTSSTS